MGLIRADRPLLTDSCSGEGSGARAGELPAGGGYEFRREPPALGTRVTADPYAIWLAQREAERERAEPTAIRWIYRHTRVTRAAAESPAARLDVTLDEREPSDGNEGFAVLA